MKKLVSVLVLLFAVSAVNADYILDDFESYADSAALQAVWVMNTNSDISTESLEPVLNGNSMLITNAGAQSAYYSQTKFTLPTAVEGVSGVNLSYLGFTGTSMTFAIPANGGSGTYDNLGGSGGDVFISMYDCWGQKVFSGSYVGSVTPSGTGWPNGIVWTVDLATGLQAGMNLENVFQITVGYNASYHGDGAMFVDDITLLGVTIPEPATMSILALGSLALIRRRK